MGRKDAWDDLPFSLMHGMEMVSGVYGALVYLRLSGWQHLGSYSLR